MLDKFQVWIPPWSFTHYWVSPMCMCKAHINKVCMLFFCKSVFCQFDLHAPRDWGGKWVFPPWQFGQEGGILGLSACSRYWSLRTSDEAGKSKVSLLYPGFLLGVQLKKGGKSFSLFFSNFRLTKKVLEGTTLGTFWLSGDSQYWLLLSFSGSLLCPMCPVLCPETLGCI